MWSKDAAAQGLQMNTGVFLQNSTNVCPQKPPRSNYISHVINFKCSACIPNSTEFRRLVGLTVGVAAALDPGAVEVSGSRLWPLCRAAPFIRLRLFRSRSIPLPTRSRHRLASAPATQIPPRTDGGLLAPPPPHHSLYKGRTPSPRVER